MHNSGLSFIQIAIEKLYRMEIHGVRHSTRKNKSFLTFYTTNDNRQTSISGSRGKTSKNAMSGCKSKRITHIISKIGYQ